MADEELREDDRPAVYGAPPAGVCGYCGAPSGTAILCPRHTCTGGSFVDSSGQWRRSKSCGRPVKRWKSKSSSGWVYGALCEECDRGEVEGRARLRKGNEQGEEPMRGRRRAGGDW